MTTTTEIADTTSMFYTPERKAVITFTKAGNLHVREAFILITSEMSAVSIQGNAPAGTKNIVEHCHFISKIPRWWQIFKLFSLVRDILRYDANQRYKGNTR